MPSPTRVLQEVRRFIAAARPDGDSDRILIDRFARTRDDRAFAELVRRHGPMVLGVCRRVLRHAADAEDAFQATFLILVRRAADLRDPDRLGSWLYGVAWRTANKLRTTRRAGLPLPDELAATTSNSDWPVELDAAIARLPEKYRTPIVLCHLQGLSPTEVAGRLGCPPATVVTRLFRARETLRRRLTALGLSVPPALVAGSVLEVPSALATAVGEMAAGRTISPAASRLADGVFLSLFMTKIRWAATAAAICLGGVGVLGFRAGGQELPPPTAPILPPAVAAPLPPPTAPSADSPGSQADSKTHGAVTTTNFRVSAPSIRIAQLVADTAERTRKDQAVAWLGKALPDRKTPWPIDVHLSNGAAGGASTFDFARSDNDYLGFFAGIMGGSGRTFAFVGSEIEGNTRVEGALDRLLADVVPHEVTHSVMAEHFRKPLPRWADEGMSILCESEEERGRYRQLNKKTLNASKGVQLRALFPRREYPANDVIGFFAQSYSVTAFLVEKKDRPTFVKFVADGMKEEGWEVAAKTHYGFANLSDLERAWIDDLKAATRVPTEWTVQPENNPTLMLATTDAADRIIVGSTLMMFRPKSTEYVPRRPPITLERAEPLQTYSSADVKVFTADGKKMEAAKLLELLRAKPTPVVVAPDWDRVEKTYAEMLKPNTIILVPPPPKPATALTVPPTIGGR